MENRRLFLLTGANVDVSHAPSRLFSNESIDEQSAITQLLQEIYCKDPKTGLIHADMDLLSRSDLSPAVRNFVTEVLYKKLPPTSTTIDDELLFSTLKSRSAQIGGELDSYVSNLRDYIDSNKPKSVDDGNV